jgi:FkbM family methyltransferase
VVVSGGASVLGKFGAGLAQRALDGLLRAGPDQPSGRLALLAYRRVRRMLARGGDPAVRYSLGGHALLLPFSHDLPVFRWRFPDYSANLARVAEQVAAKYPELTIVDIGANVGDSVALIRERVAAPTLCIEGDPAYLACLDANVAGLQAVVVAREYVGRPNGRDALVSRSAGGTASLVAGGDGDFVRLRPLSALLEEHPRFLRSKLVKIDTDGMDSEIVLSELDWVAVARPVLFLEYDPDLAARAGQRSFALFEGVRGAGYRFAAVYENTGDYLLSVDLEDTRILVDLHSFLIGRGGQRYFDLCLFHADDADLFEVVRGIELARHAARGASSGGPAVSGPPSERSD